MAFSNYLIKIIDTTNDPNVGDWAIPMEYIALESYKVTPNIRMDLDPMPMVCCIVMLYLT